MDMRWAILALLFVARISLGFQFQTLGSVSSELVEELGLNYTEIGSLIGLFMVPGMFLAIPAGLAGRFVSDRFIVGLGLLTLGAGGGLASIAESYELLAAARLICGAGFVFSTIFFTKIVADLFAGKELATAMGAFVMSWPCGIAMGQIGHGWLAANFDWRLAFVVTSLYCVISALLVMIFCREAPDAAKQSGGFRFTLNRNEIFLTLIAALVWALFNAGYIVYLSFAPRVLVADGYDMVSALSVISLASWLMIFSGVVCGLIADRSGKPDLTLYVCMAAAIVALMFLFITPLAIPSSLLFGLMGIAPAGVIMALTAQAMKPENRAIGMGLFFTTYFLVQAPAPAIAGWLYDLTRDELWPILFAVALFLFTAIANLAFRIAKKRLPI
jgi:predicted MFS family arabinose efflux permease